VDEDGETESQVAGMLGELVATEVVADGDDGAVDTVFADESGEVVDGAQDGETVDWGALGLGVVVDQTGDGGNAGAPHEIQQHAGVSASSVDDDGHGAPDRRNP
jgi:hypothetical protein